MGRTVAIIAARLTSQRLPGKVLMDISGKTMLTRVVERVKRAKLVDRVIVATDPAMHTLIPDVCYYVGSAEDVLERFYRAAHFLEADVIVRITGDCPLIDPAIIDECVRVRASLDVPYLSNIDPPLFPDGLDVEVFTFAALEQAWQKARLPSDREHVTPWMRANLRTTSLRANLYSDEPSLPGYRWCVDTAEDLEFVRAVYAEMGEAPFGMQDVLALLARKPELGAINARQQRNAKYLAQLEEEQNG